MIKIVIALIALMVVIGLPLKYSLQSQNLAESYSKGAFCWVLPGADGPQKFGHIREMHLSLSPPSAFGFWTDAIERVGRGIYTLPHFAIAIPQPELMDGSRLLGWSYGENDYYDISHRASVLGIFWFPDDCAALLTEASP